MTFQEWRDLVLIAVCVVWYNAAFFPVAQVEAELRELALTLPADAEAKVFPFDKEIDMKLLQPMTIRRLQVLREELAAPPEEGSLEVESPAEGEPNDSENEPENEGKDDDFRVAIKAGDQVALLVDSGVEGVPFLIGDVLDSSWMASLHGRTL